MMVAAKKYKYEVTHSDGSGGGLVLDTIEGTSAEYNQGRAEVLIYDGDDLVGLFNFVSRFVRT